MIRENTSSLTLLLKEKGTCITKTPPSPSGEGRPAHRSLGVGGGEVSMKKKPGLEGLKNLQECHNEWSRNKQPIKTVKKSAMTR